MIRALLTVLLSLLLWPAPADAVSWVPKYTADVYRSKIANFIGWFCQVARADRRRTALELVDPVVDVALSYDINPAILASIVTHESSWRPDALGKLGERGLLQVMRGKAATPREQLHEGARILAAAWALCGTVEGAISMYATGKGCRVYKGARPRVRLAERIEEEF